MNPPPKYKPLRIGPKQRAVFARYAKALQEEFPDVDPNDILTKGLAPQMLGHAPDWSDPVGYQLRKGNTFSGAAFCVYWGEDPDTGKIVALLHIRKEKDEHGHKVGAIGGHLKHPTNKDEAEQSFMGAIRECTEEVRKASREPVFIPEMSRYTLVVDGEDYAHKNEKEPVKYTGYAYKLTPEEIQKLKQHIANWDNFTGYRKNAKAASHNETCGLKLMPLEEIAKISPDRFTYHRQCSLFRTVANRLGVGELQVKPSTPVGYSIGDSPDLFVSRIVSDPSGKITSRHRAW